ncbi:Inhibitor of growth protein 2 [Toxocara canis]|uniref:Inhibitor of growth protein 2 n=1 Tax=Toxocara canis TaxID=6265 RepID=A0A0B2VD52_TOXCA|nr:Inhibitor of growth protein 2 [Toxocara canis]
MWVNGAMERDPSLERMWTPNVSPKALESMLERYLPINDYLKHPMDDLLDLDVAYQICMQQLIATQRMLRRKHPMDDLLDLDVAYQICMQQLIATQRMLRRKDMPVDEINRLLDRAERELVLAQKIAFWKRDVLISTNKQLYALTGRKNKPKTEKAVIPKSKVRAKKTAASSVKESVRRSERERRSPCIVKPKEKEIPLAVVVTPEANGQLTCRTKRKGKESDCVADSASSSSSKKRTSGRLAKPARKKQLTTTVAQPAPTLPADEPTYCLCEQISFGEMIGCDNEKCLVEWFHFECVQLKVKPKGKWYCPMCRGDRFNVLKSSLAR